MFVMLGSDSGLLIYIGMLKFHSLNIVKIKRSNLGELESIPSGENLYL